MRRLSVHPVLIVVLWATGWCFSAGAVENEHATPLPETISDETPIAQVADVVITGGEFRRRYVREIGPSYDSFLPDKDTPTLLDVADLLVREKVLALEAREQGLLNDPQISWNLESTCRSQLINYYVEKAVRPTIEVTDEAIQTQMEKTPKLTREQVVRGLQNQKIRAKLAVQIKGLYDSLHVHKIQDHITAAAALYAKLLNRPEMDRPKNTPWVLKEQMLSELTPDQQKLELVTYDGGAFTLIDFMKVIHGVVPTKRPKDLVQAEGVEKVLDASLGGVLIEAYIRSLDLIDNRKWLNRSGNKRIDVC